MRTLRKRVLASKDENQQLPLITFKRSLRDWNARWKAQRASHEFGLQTGKQPDDNPAQGCRSVHP
jgi:hypothetical protein